MYFYGTGKFIGKRFERQFSRQEVYIKVDIILVTPVIH